MLWHKVHIYAHASVHMYTHTHKAYTYIQAQSMYKQAKQLHILLVVSNNYKDSHYLCVAGTNSDLRKEDLFWLIV